MITLKYLIPLLIIAFIQNTHSKGISPRNKLLYLMIDGFRYDYVDMQPEENLPAFTQFLKEGGRAEFTHPIFPSISYPSWTTLATGLYAESHGITGNYMYDPADNDTFELYDNEKTSNHKWWSAEPIWVTATKKGINTAAVYFSKCDVSFDGVVPNDCEPFEYREDELGTFRENIDKAMNKFREGAEFVLLYTDHIDHEGHDFGPESDKMKREIRNIDTELGRILSKEEEYGLKGKLNIVIVSDHGMKETTAESSTTFQKLSEYCDINLLEKIVESGAWSNIKVKDGFVDEFYAQISTVPGITAYKHNDIPDELHFKNHRLILDIVYKADPDTFVVPTNSDKMLPEWSDKISVGNHGYWSREEDKMKGIFFARGPDIKPGHNKIPGIEVVDVYPALAYLLDLEPLPNNGSFNRVSPIFKDSEQMALSSATSLTYYPVILIVALISFIGIF